jgi:FkbM family methyltransferase
MLGHGNGAWWVPIDALGQGSICYCVGAGVNISLDLTLASDYGCDVWTFDPTPQAIQYVRQQATPDNFRFEPIGIWVEDTTVHFQTDGGSHSITRTGIATLRPFDGQVERLSTVMRRLAHDRIDLLKLDIEGAEGPVLEQLISGSIRPGVLLVEFDQPEPPWRTVARVRAVLDAGYRLDRIDHWNYSFSRIQ